MCRGEDEVPIHEQEFMDARTQGLEWLEGSNLVLVWRKSPQPGWRCDDNHIHMVLRRGRMMPVTHRELRK